MTKITFFILIQFFILPMAWSKQLYPVDIESDSAKVKFLQVEVHRQNDQLLLTGKVKRRSYNSTVLPGHIDYIISDSQGQIIAEGVTNYAPSLSLRGWKFGSHFSVNLPDNLPEDSRIKLSWQRNH